MNTFKGAFYLKSFTKHSHGGLGIYIVVDIFVQESQECHIIFVDVHCSKRNWTQNIEGKPKPEVNVKKMAVIVTPNMRPETNQDMSQTPNTKTRSTSCMGFEKESHWRPDDLTAEPANSPRKRLSKSSAQKVK